MPRADIISYWDATSIHSITKRSPPILPRYQPTLKMNEKRMAKAHLSAEFYNSDITTYNKSSCQKERDFSQRPEYHLGEGSRIN